VSATKLNIMGVDSHTLLDADRSPEAVVTKIVNSKQNWY